MRPRIYMAAGMTFGCLTLTGMSNNVPSSLLWECLCICGKTTWTTGHHLRSGHVVSCGCLKKERYSGNNNPKYQHGNAVGTVSPEYTAYLGARYRCTDPSYTNWKRYGGRGIEFRFTSFQEFMKELGPRPNGLELD